jgi:alcohol dehydrogenase, propanol-preferring
MLEEVAKHGITVKTNLLKGIDQVPELVKLSEEGKIKGKGIIVIDEDAIKRERSWAPNTKPP